MTKNAHNMMLFFLIISQIFIAMANAETLVELKEFRSEEVKIAGFSISNGQEITIELTAIMPRKYTSKVSFSSAWILNADSREVVWVSQDAEIDDRDGIRATLKDEIKLEPGTFEVYYSTYPYYYSSDNWYNRSQDGFFSYIFNDDKDYIFEDEYEEMYLRIEGIGSAISEDELLKRQEQFRDNSFVSFSRVRDEEMFDQVFKVEKPVELNVYAIGEARRDGEYDFGWIVNLKTREKVWRLNYKESEHAGGARKNRASREKINIEPGTYRIMYVTDDSHSYNRWNMAPPYDPEFWGVTVWFENPSDKQYLAKLDTENNSGITPIVEFNKVRDREYLSQGFSLKERMDVQIYALGEGSDGDMYDYGWIVDLTTRKTVWKMDYYETESGGGDEKNRLFDGIITLDAGKYMVYYITDDSHAYHSWNTGEPYDKKKWGITVSVPAEKVNQAMAIEYDESQDKSVLVKMTRVGDSDRRRARFELSEDQHVNIYAIGEGDDGHMYDYAWIEDANTGKVMWEMTYRKTKRAGGAHKNRMFDDNILLPSGEYYVIFESDDSHSFADWNASPPHDPINWGITVTLAQNYFLVYVYLPRSARSTRRKFE